jgi:threonine dehydrogenase-like Zn-dependent dehydrogenase
MLHNSPDVGRAAVETTHLAPPDGAAATVLVGSTKHLMSHAARRVPTWSIENGAMSGIATATRTMRAAVLAGPGEARIEEVERPEPGPRQVRVRLEGCGVCASNLTPWAGPEWMRFPTGPGALGHEGWGVVDAVGSGVKGISAGDRVAALSHNAYAEYDLADADAVVPLPDSLAGQPFPGEPLGCAMNIFRRSDIEAGQTVAIVGIGFLGAILTRLATDAGARVIAVSRRRFSLEVAREFGAAATIPMEDHDAIIGQVKELTGGAFCDWVIEAVGKQWPLDLAAELTRERGKMIIAGYHQHGPRQVNMQLWNWRGLDVINAHERDPKIYMRGIREAVDAVASGRLDPKPLYTHTFPLDRLGEALDATRDRPDGFLKALVTP